MDWVVENKGYYIYLTVDGKLNSKLFLGSEHPILGWQSKRYDSKDKTHTLLNSYECLGNCEIVTIISL